jgi:hypothetical protein
MDSTSSIPTLTEKSLPIEPLDWKNAGGPEFAFSWSKVREVAAEQHCNFADYLCLPLGAKLAKKAPKSSATLWFTPFNELFIVSIHSKRKIDFFDPLHGMLGYIEYGSGYLKPNSRPFMHWDGSTIYRIHPVDGPVSGEELVEDFGSLFGLSTADADSDVFQELLNNPSANFDYATVPQSPIKQHKFAGARFNFSHVLFMGRWG